ncbi:MAG: polysaccharide lyase family protein [Luteolibacter sp.]
MKKQPIRSLIAVFFLSWLAVSSSRAGNTETSVPVTLQETATSWLMDNGIVKATIDKKSSNLTSLIYRKLELMGPGGIWQQPPAGQVQLSVTIDPKQNSGDRAEVSLRGTGKRMNIEIRYTLERGASGIYTYAIYTHPANYPAGGFGESRFITKLDPRFDWLTVDDDRNLPMCDNDDIRKSVVIHAKEQKILSTGLYQNSVEHKYSYCARPYALPAYGWSSIKDHIGIWFINSSTEYLSGGPNRMDLVCHLDATIAHPIILNYWTSGHYAGGTNSRVNSGQDWNKVIGPIFVYCNDLTSPAKATDEELETFRKTQGNPTIPQAWTANATALFKDAIAHSAKIRAQWPFPWVKAADYLHKEQRGQVTGQLVLDDPQAASTTLPQLRVGLARPDYQGNGGKFANRSGNGKLVTWEHDALYYQFWTQGNDDGTFTIPNVHPGSYTLYAFSNQVLDTFSKADITVKAGETLDLGKLEWNPVRYGKQLWEIGIPDRTGCEFYKGDGKNYWLWGWPLRYPLLFPQDPTYVIGQSDYRKDWFFIQCPRGESREWLNPKAPDPAHQRFGWMQKGTPGKDMWEKIGRGTATTRTIRFDLPASVQGTATLRVALAGSDGNRGNGSTGGLGIAVNDQPVGNIQYISTNALRYNTAMGVWREYKQAFDAKLLKTGENRITLTVPAGDLTTGVVYDYLRLELTDR